VQGGLAGLTKHTDLGRSRIQGAQLGWQGHKHTKVLQDPSMKARRPQGGHFGVQETSIAANHPAEPLYQGIGDLSNNRHTDHGGPTKIVDLLNASNLYGVVDLQAPRMIWQLSEAHLP
jgi:hypothetical protein